MDSSPLTGGRQDPSKEQRIQSYATTGWEKRRYTCNTKYLFTDCEFTLIIGESSAHLWIIFSPIHSRRK